MEINKKKKKIVCYVRSSFTDKDLMATYSAEAQKESLRKYCKNHSYKVGRYFVDSGYPGMDLNRPALKKMLKEVIDGKIERIVCANTDRLTKNWMDADLMEKIFETNNISFTFMSGECYFDLYGNDLEKFFQWRESKALLDNLTEGKNPSSHQVVSSCGKKLSAKKPKTVRRYRHKSNVDRSHLR